jgi:hypothetical protein
MLYYPQLSSGAVSQLPVTQRTSIRTISNGLLGGDTITMTDTNDSSKRWQVQYVGLTDAEWASIEQLFEAAEGQLTTFTFLDPTDNLLMWSEDWVNSVWTADPLLEVVSGIQDPLGANNAVQLTNTGQATQGIKQDIAGASWFQYCFSVYLRSNVSAVIQMVVSAGGQNSFTAISTGPAWVRAIASGSLTIQQDGVAFGVQLVEGASIQAFGPQVEAQTAASQYKKTIDLGGVYPNTRFDSDSLTLSTDAPNQNSGTVSLYSSLISI